MAEGKDRVSIQPDGTATYPRRLLTDAKVIFRKVPDLMEPEELIQMLPQELLTPGELYLPSAPVML